MPRKPLDPYAILVRASSQASPLGAAMIPSMAALYLLLGEEVYRSRYHRGSSVPEELQSIAPAENNS